MVTPAGSAGGEFEVRIRVLCHDCKQKPGTNFLEAQFIICAAAGWSRYIRHAPHARVRSLVRGLQDLMGDNIRVKLCREFGQVTAPQRSAGRVMNPTRVVLFWYGFHGCPALRIGVGLFEKLLERDFYE